MGQMTRGQHCPALPQVTWAVASDCTAVLSENRALASAAALSLPVHVEILEACSQPVLLACTQA